MKIKIEASKLDCFLYGVGLGSMAAFAILQIWSAMIVIAICMGTYTFREEIYKKGKGEG